MADPPALTRLVAALAAAPRFAVDTESNSLHAYRERVCLMQFSTPARDFILDPLAVKDLSPLAPLFSDAHREKVFHAAEYDMICLKRDFGFRFAGVFDTMMAARALGWTKVGLGSILEEHYGVRLSKRLQRADWGRRPLTAELLAYAQVDTHFLLSLRDRLHTDLHKAGRWEDARQEFVRLAEAPPADWDGDGRRPLWRLMRTHDLTPRQTAILWEVMQYREEVARRIDQPVFKVIDEATLVEVALRAAAGRVSFEGIRGMTPGQIQRHGDRLRDAVERGMKAPPLAPPIRKRLDRAASARMDALKEWRKQRAAERGMASDLVLSKEAIRALAEANPATVEALGEIEGLSDWHREKYGEEILRCLREAGSGDRRGRFGENHS